MFTVSVSKHLGSDGKVWFTCVTITGEHITLSAGNTAIADVYLQPEDVADFAAALRQAAATLESAS